MKWLDDDDKEPPMQCAYEKRTLSSRLKVETIITNENCRIFHVGNTYSEERYLEVWERNKPSDERTPAIFDELGKIDGIEHIFGRNAYQIWITKGDVFDWQVLEPQIAAVLTALLGL